MSCTSSAYGNVNECQHEPADCAVQSTWSALSTIVRAEGPRGLFRGVVPTVATNAPFSALYYLFYKQLQGRLAKASLLL